MPSAECRVLSAECRRRAYVDVAPRGRARGGGRVMRAIVSPPTATQATAVGHARAVRVSGVYAVVDGVKVAPASLLSATAPVPMTGVPTQFVPTRAQDVVVGQATPNTSSTAGGSGEALHVLPPLLLSRRSPLAGTTSLTVVDVVPAARQLVELVQAALRSRPTPGGTVAEIQVMPPLVLRAKAPCPWPAVVGVNPATRQVPAEAHERVSSPPMPAGRVPCRSQVWPKLDVTADQSAVPSLATTVQSAAVVHFTEVTAMDPAGGTDGAQLFPPFC